MNNTVEIPENFPKTLQLQEVERILDGFGYELTMRPKEAPAPKPPIGFGHQKGESK